jgi:hypothetical protein
MNKLKTYFFLCPNENLRILDINFTEYDFQEILDYLYLLPSFTYLFDVPWLIKQLTQWLFHPNIISTENVVISDKRFKNDEFVKIYNVSNKYPKYKTYNYNINFILDSDDNCRKLIEQIQLQAYDDYKELQTNPQKTLDVYCIIAREPKFTLYYPTEETIPEKYKRWLNDFD